jgi:hypothetical protein
MANEPKGAMSSPFGKGNNNQTEEAKRLLDKYSGKARGWGDQKNRNKPLKEESWGTYGDEPDWVKYGVPTNLPNSEREKLIAQKKKELEEKAKEEEIQRRVQEELNKSNKVEEKLEFSAEELAAVIATLGKEGTIVNANTEKVVIEVNGDKLVATKSSEDGKLFNLNPGE